MVLASPSSSAKRARQVVLLKWFLVSLAFVLLALLIGWPLLYGERSDEHLEIAFPSMDTGEHNTTSMVKPNFQGVDQFNRPYSVTADLATQQDNDTILLHKLFAEITLDDGRWYSMISEKGTLDMSRKTLDAYGDINILSDKGFEVRTDSAHFNMAQGGITGVEPVAIQGPMGILKATGFVVEQQGDVMRFDGRVRLTVYVDHYDTTDG